MPVAEPKDSDFTVAVYHTSSEVSKHNQTLLKILYDRHLRVVDLDDAAVSADPIAASYEVLALAQAYIAIVGSTHELTLPTDERNPKNLSLMELQLQAAQDHRLPCLVFLMGPAHPGRAAGSERGFAPNLRGLLGDGSLDVRGFNSFKEFSEAARKSTQDLLSGLQNPGKRETGTISYQGPDSISQSKASPKAKQETSTDAAKGYVARPEALQALRSWLTSDPAPICLLEGEDGSGKTSLVSTWLKHDLASIQSTYANTYQYRFTSSSRLEDLCIAFLLSLGITPEPEVDVRALFVDQIRTGKHVVVVDDLDVLNVRTDPVTESFLPSGQISQIDGEFLQKLSLPGASKLLLICSYPPSTLVKGGEAPIPGVTRIRITGAPSADRPPFVTHGGPPIDVPGYASGPAGYNSEFCGVGGTHPVPDHLNVGAYSNRLAELIALRETKLPLAIGLFGNWGSGKSHFMNLMDRKLKLLTEEEKKRPEGESERWCKEIVPIYFNAWHYLDSNLWASLVSQIFESLFAHLRPKQDDLARVQKLLEQASGATARAAEEAGVAKAAIETAKSDLQSAQEARLREENVVEGLLRGLDQLLPGRSLQDLQAQAKAIDAKKTVRTIDELRIVAAEAKTVGGMMRALWNSFWAQPGRGSRMGWLVAAVSASVATCLLVKWVLPQLESAGWIAGAFPMLAGVGALLARAKKPLRTVAEWLARAEEAQIEARRTPEVVAAEARVASAMAVEEVAKGVLAEAQVRENQLKEELKALAPGRRLGRFIEQRAQSSDYRGQLGLISLARRDFQELSEVFADAEALRAKVTTLKKAGMQKEAEEMQELSKSIDRIVLFVDDLDRCQPDKVVEVLQAVHLLLAFPLFAVVVGVDQRCLRQSLRLQFRGLLEQELDDNPNLKKTPGKMVDENERPATALDYLEKIFHVPFHLPTMNEFGFGQLIQKLTEMQPAESNAEKIGVNVHETITPGVKDAAGLMTEPPPDELAKGEPKDLVISVKSIPAPDRGDADEGAPVEVKVIGSVPLERWEREALKDYHSLIQTPRGATRLLNTYRLVRAGVPEKDWEVFYGDGAKKGEFRLAMLLLAAAAGYPAVARTWFAHLRRIGMLQAAVEGSHKPASDVGWDEFKKVHANTMGAATAHDFSEEILIGWLDRVEQFAF
jgi:hypothetical protein